MAGDRKQGHVWRNVGIGTGVVLLGGASLFAAPALLADIGLGMQQGPITYMYESAGQQMTAATIAFGSSALIAGVGGILGAKAGNILDNKRAARRAPENKKAPEQEKEKAYSPEKQHDLSHLRDVVPDMSGLSPERKVDNPEQYVSAGSASISSANHEAVKQSLTEQQSRRGEEPAPAGLSH